MVQSSSDSPLAERLRPPQPTRPRPATLLREDVYDTLRDAIIEGRLTPGERLRDADIAEVLEVSRMPVREALRRLADDGLVIAEASRWTKVAPLDFEAAARVYPIIWTLECLALRSVESWKPDQLAAMREANDALAAALADGDPVAASLADGDFHGVVLDAAGNPELSAIVAEMKSRIRRIEVGYFGGSVMAGESCREHESVVAGLESGEFDTALASLELNWRRSQQRAVERVRQLRSPEDVAR